MKQKFILRRLAAGLLLAAVVASGAAASAVNNTVDPSAKGSITAQMRDSKSKSAVAGGELTIYRVAKIQQDDANFSYQYTNGFENCGVALGDLSDSGLADKLQAKIPNSARKTTKTIGKDGRAIFGNLRTGLYLVVQTKSAEGYQSIGAFLVSVPMKDGENWIYDVNASPKMEAAVKKTSHTPPKKPSIIPKTGQLDWPVPVLTIAGLLLLLLGWNLREENEQNEK